MTVPQSVLLLMALTLLKNTGHFVFLSIWVCLIFSHDQIEITHFLQSHRSAIVPFSVLHIKRCTIWICLITDDVNFNHLFKVVSARFLHCKVRNFYNPLFSWSNCSKFGHWEALQAGSCALSICSHVHFVHNTFTYFLNPNVLSELLTPTPVRNELTNWRTVFVCGSFCL